MDAGRDHQILCTRHHALRREMHRLLGGTALTVDGHAGNVFRQTSGQPTRASDIASLWTDRVEATHDDVVHRTRVNARAVHQLLEGVSAQVRWMDLAQRAASTTYRGADAVDDVGLSHECSSGRTIEKTRSNERNSVPRWRQARQF